MRWVKLYLKKSVPLPGKANAILENIIKLLLQLKVNIVAEGVETKEMGLILIIAELPIYRAIIIPNPSVKMRI